MQENPLENFTFFVLDDIRKHIAKEKAQKQGEEIINIIRTEIHKDLQARFVSLNVIDLCKENIGYLKDNGFRVFIVKQWSTFTNKKTYFISWLVEDFQMEVFEPLLKTFEKYENNDWIEL